MIQSRREHSDDPSHSPGSPEPQVSRSRPIGGGLVQEISEMLPLRDDGDGLLPALAGDRGRGPCVSRSYWPASSPPRALIRAAAVRAAVVSGESRTISR